MVISGAARLRGQAAVGGWPLSRAAGAGRARAKPKAASDADGQQLYRYSNSAGGGTGGVHAGDGNAQRRAMEGGPQLRARTYMMAAASVPLVGRGRGGIGTGTGMSES